MRWVELLQCTYVFDDDLTDPIVVPSGYVYVGCDDLDQAIGREIGTEAIYLFPESDSPVYLGKSEVAFEAMAQLASSFDFSSGDRADFQQRINNIDPSALADANGLWAYIIETHFEEA